MSLNLIAATENVQGYLAELVEIMSKLTTLSIAIVKQNDFKSEINLSA